MSNALPPIAFTWDGESMVPLNPHWARRADQTYAIGQTYTLVEHQERSTKSHAFYFASITDLWHSLPDHLSAEFPTPDALRKRALIRTGYRDQRSIVCASNAEALRVAAFIRPLDSYAEVSVAGCVVVHLTAQSQDYKSMDRKTFGESKTRVLDWISNLLGIDGRREGRAA